MYRGKIICGHVTIHLIKHEHDFQSFAEKDVFDIPNMNFEFIVDFHIGRE